MKSYKSWSKARNIDIDSELEYQRDISADELPFQSVSNQRIPYPLPEDLREKFDENESQKKTFPNHFVPTIKSTTCPHGNGCDDQDPVKMRWDSLHVSEDT